MPVGWIVTIAIAALCAAAGLFYLRLKGAGQESGSGTAEEPVIDKPEPLPAVDRLQTQLLFQGQYRAIAAGLSIPRNSRIVDKVIDIFSLKNVQVTHYCWKTKDALYAFPVWESVEALLSRDDAWIFHYKPGDENNINQISLPLGKIISYTVTEPGGQVVLGYLNFAGNEAVCVFCGKDAADTIRHLIPEKQRALVVRRVYLSSARNIQDIQEEVEQFRDQWARGVITKEEYERLKTACVLRM